jgi:hypothetical protein
MAARLLDDRGLIVLLLLLPLLLRYYSLETPDTQLLARSALLATQEAPVDAPPPDAAEAQAVGDTQRQLADLRVGGDDGDGDDSDTSTSAGDAAGAAADPAVPSAMWRVTWFAPFLAGNAPGTEALRCPPARLPACPPARLPARHPHYSLLTALHALGVQRGAGAERVHQGASCALRCGPQRRVRGGPQAEPAHAAGCARHAHAHACIHLPTRRRQRACS